MADVLSDLKAQAAANAKGIELLRELMRQYSTPVVLRYMSHVQSNAAV
jgi:5-oxoprolinase (ATP-hydrolysing)